MPECFTIFADEVEGRLNPAYYRNKNPFLQSKYELINIENYFIVNPKFQNSDNLKVVSFLPMKNINSELQEVDKFDRIEIEKIKGYTPFEEGDLVFAKVTPCMENGNLAICENMPFKIGVGTSEIYVFREKQKNKTSNKFLKVLFSINKFRQFAKNNFTGTGGLQRVPRDFFNNLKIPLPPLATQNKIVSLMDKSYSSKKSKESEALKLLDSINDYVLDELGIKLPELKDKMCFVVNYEEIKKGRIDPTNFANPQDTLNSNKFKEKNLYEVASLVKGQSITKENITSGDYPVVAGGQSSPYSINVYNHKGNVITVSASGAYSGYVWYHQNSIFASDCTVIKSLDEKEVSTFYLYCVMKAKQKFIYNMQQGAGQPHVYSRDLSNIKIPLPPLAVQNKIADEVKKRMQKAETLQKEAKEELEKAKLEVEKIILG